MADREPKVSVVIAAYASSEEGLRRVFDSLDAQTLPQEEFEVVVVDDGSPDDPLARLEGYARTRPNLRYSSIENSGWASRPRNVGIEQARGEYVLFMDHDDYLYPDALRRVHEFAAANRSDVVSAKEIKSDNVGWGFENFRENRADAVPDDDITALLPMVPHKLYRREFLLEHGIRFPEGRRMLWEDIYFNVAAWKSAQVVSVLGDTPVYRWTITGENSSSTYGPDSEEFWQRLTDLMEFIDRTLSGQGHEAARRTMLLQQYRVRVISRFHPLLAIEDHPALPMAMSHVRSIQERWVPADWDAGLGKFDRARSVLLRAGRPDLLRALHLAEVATIGKSTVESLEWSNGVLRIATTVRWVDDDGRFLTLRRSADGRLLRELPAEVADVLGEEVLDLSDELDSATSEVTIHDRASKVTWGLPTTATAAFEPVGGDLVTLVQRAVAELDPATAAFGSPLAAPTWDLHARNSFATRTNHRAVEHRGGPAPAIVNGTPVTAYSNTKGALSIDVGQYRRSVLKDARGFDEAADHGRLRAFSAPVLGLPVTGEGSVPVAAALRAVTGTPEPKNAPDAGRLEGRLGLEGGTVRFTGSGTASRGTYRLVFGLGSGSTTPSALTATVSFTGKVRFGGS